MHLPFVSPPHHAERSSRPPGSPSPALSQGITQCKSRSSLETSKLCAHLLSGLVLCFVFLFFEAGSQYLAQAGLELTGIPLLQPPSAGLQACAAMPSFYLSELKESGSTEVAGLRLGGWATGHSGSPPHTLVSELSVGLNIVPSGGPAAGTMHTCTKSQRATCRTAIFLGPIQVTPTLAADEILIKGYAFSLQKTIVQYSNYDPPLPRSETMPHQAGEDQQSWQRRLRLLKRGNSPWGQWMTSEKTNSLQAGR